MGRRSPKTPLATTERAPLQAGQADDSLFSPHSTAMGRTMGQFGQPETRRGDRGRSAMDGSETPEREREQALLEHLRDLIDEAGQGGAARQLGVDRKTLCC